MVQCPPFVPTGADLSEPRGPHLCDGSAPPPLPPAEVMEIPPFMDLLSPHRLKPFTSYKFRVKATNDIGDSEFSEESEPLTTLQAGQHPPPGCLSLGPLGTS